MPISVTVSHGVAGFDSLVDLAGAIENADREMYQRRNEIRGAQISELRVQTIVRETVSP